MLFVKIDKDAFVAQYTIAKYTHDLSLLMDYAPDGIPDKELSYNEYERMARTAEQGGNTRLSLLVQTLCALGLRVSELKAITVESLESGEATIQNDEFIILLWVFTFSEKLSKPWENTKLYRVKIH